MLIDVFSVVGTQIHRRRKKKSHFNCVSHANAERPLSHSAFGLQSIAGKRTIDFYRYPVLLHRSRWLYRLKREHKTSTGFRLGVVAIFFFSRLLFNVCGHKIFHTAQHSASPHILFVHLNSLNNRINSTEFFFLHVLKLNAMSGNLFSHQIGLCTQRKEKKTFTATIKHRINRHLRAIS